MAQLPLLASASMVVIAALSRLLPHPANFSPVGAMALFGGVVLAAPVAAYGVPIAAMLLSDLLLEVVTGQGLHGGMVVVYSCLLATTWLGRRLGARPGTGAIAAASVLAAMGFFVVTNLAVWAFEGIYPLEARGLQACFLAAVPFFGNTLAGQLVFGGVLFGGHRLLARWMGAAVTKPLATLAAPPRS
jgi:hypothetical protein